MMDQTLRIKVLIIDINTAEHTDKIKIVFFVERETLCECKLYAEDTSLFSVCMFLSCHVRVSE